MHVAASSDHDVTGPFLMIVELSGGIVLPVEVADLVAEGLTNHAIARRLSVAPRTAEAHVENIRRKLEAHSRAQIAAWVTEHRLRR
jgi:DNA-binding CsgD family transcriptional regulator